jgi:ubiquitin
MAPSDLGKLAKSLANDLSKRGFKVKTERISTENGKPPKEMEIEDFNYFLEFI